MDCVHTTALTSFLGLAVAWDLAERRIPNRLVGGYALAALGLAFATAGVAGLARAAGGFAGGLGLLLVPFALGFVGAGDAKFFAAVGAFLGPWLTLRAFLFGTALGAPLALAAEWRARGTLGAFVALQSSAWGCSRRPDAAGARTALPYAVPLALGTLTALALDWIA